MGSLCAPNSFNNDSPSSLDKNVPHLQQTEWWGHLLHGNVFILQQFDKRFPRRLGSIHTILLDGD